MDRIGARLASGAEHPNVAKRRLAREIVALYHPAGAAEAAEAAFDLVFKAHRIPEDVPEVAVASASPLHLPAVLAEAGLASSNAEARRLIDQGGVRIDGEVVAPRAYDIALANLDGRVLQVGKRRFARVRAK